MRVRGALMPALLLTARGRMVAPAQHMKGGVLARPSRRPAGMTQGKVEFLMSTAESIRESGSITLSREGRYALGLVVERNATMIGEEIGHATGLEALEAAVGRAERHLRAMRGATTGEISREDAACLRPLVAGLLAGINSEVISERGDREAYLKGDERWGYDGKNRAQVLATYAKEIERHTQEAAWCDAFLTQVAR